MASETITRNDLTNILNEVLPPTPSEYKKLLWTNPSPTSAFAQQTISLDLSEYDAIEVESNYTTANTFGAVTQLFSVADGKKQSGDVPQAQGTPRATRGIYAENTGVKFTVGGYVIGSAYTQNDSYCIPIRIYGIKYDRVAPPQVEVADYIVEEGTSGIWKYRKWNSGIAECWGVYYSTSEALAGSNPLNSGGKYWLKTIAYPIQFIEYPVVSTTASIGSGYAIMARNYDNLTGVQVLYYTSMTSSTATVRAGFYVIGRWK